MLILLAIAIVSVPVFFTLYKEGRFTPKPTVSIVSTVTDPNAKTLTFAADYDFNPYSFYDVQGNPSGQDIEIATEIANRMGMKMKFVLGDWQQCKAMIKNEEADVLLGLEIFADSSKTSTVKTIPVSHDTLKIYGKNSILDVGSLYGKKVAITAGSVLMDIFPLNCEYVQFNTNTDVLEAVDSGAVDYGICHASVATKIIEHNNLHLVPSMTLMESFPAMGIRKTAPELVEPINLVIKEMADEGIIDNLYNKWIAMNGSNKSFITVIENNLLFYIIYICVAIIFLCGIIFFLTLLRMRENKLEMALTYQKVLEEKKKQAEDASKAKSVFLQNMSHDIRTPMNAILGFSDIAIQNIDDREKALDALKKARYSSEHLLQIINDILDMSRIESGKIELHEEVINIKEHMSRLEDMFRFSMEKKGLTFTVINDTHTEYIYGDSLRLSQILANLLSNAMKFTKAGGTITYQCVESATDEQGHTKFEIHIIDTGIGMSEAFQQHLFQPFERERSATVSGVEGTGLGLSIAKKLTDMMGGSLSCKSKLGVGTEFTIVLTAKVATKPISQDSDKSTTPLSFTGKKVLLVEDNELNREIALNILKNAGFTVNEAVDGKDAVDKITASSEYYDLILMDVQMPIMDGYEAAHEIRTLSDSKKARTPIIAMTANAFDEDKQKAIEAGMNEHIAKPIDVAQMMKIIQKVLTAQTR